MYLSNIDTNKSFETWVNLATNNYSKGFITVTNEEQDLFAKPLIPEIPFTEFGTLGEGLDCFLSDKKVDTSCLKVSIVNKSQDIVVIARLKKRIKNDPPDNFGWHIWNGFYLEKTFSVITDLHKDALTKCKKSYNQFHKEKNLRNKQY